MGLGLERERGSDAIGGERYQDTLHTSKPQPKRGRCEYLATLFSIISCSVMLPRVDGSTPSPGVRGGSDVEKAQRACLKG